MSFFLSISSAVLLLLGLPPFEFFPAAWMGWLPLFVLCYDRRFTLRDIVGASFLTGFIYYGRLLYWLLSFSPQAYLTVLAALSFLFPFYFAAAGLIHRRYRCGGIPALLIPPVLWFLFLFVLSFSPFGQMPLRIPFHGPLEFHQLAALSTIDLLGCLVIALNASIARFLLDKKTRNLISPAALAVLFAVVFFWGGARMKQAPALSLPSIALLQHNLPMDPVWREKNQEEIRETYRKMAEEAAKSSPRLIVFPQYSLPEDPMRNSEFLTNLSRKIGVSILISSHIPVTTEEEVFEKGYRNMALLFSPDGKIETRTATMSAPFQPVPEITSGSYEILETPAGTAGMLLCYEDTRPEIAKKAEETGTDFLIALSNPGHFTNSLVPGYHLKEDQLRAIETGLPLLRVSANGYSAIIDSGGKIIKKTNLGERRILNV